ncbi:hypothetical protein ACRRTK_009540 [Alexandromys fortis]
MCYLWPTVALLGQYESRLSLADISGLSKPHVRERPVKNLVSRFVCTQEMNFCKMN